MPLQGFHKGAVASARLVEGGTDRQMSHQCHHRLLRRRIEAVFALLEARRALAHATYPRINSLKQLSQTASRFSVAAVGKPVPVIPIDCRVADRAEGAFAHSSQRNSLYCSTVLPRARTPALNCASAPRLAPHIFPPSPSPPPSVPRALHAAARLGGRAGSRGPTRAADMAPARSRATTALEGLPAPRR